jgi:cell fate regulator YaaT (PSP1 superfamily)
MLGRSRFGFPRKFPIFRVKIKEDDLKNDQLEFENDHLPNSTGNHNIVGVRFQRAGKVVYFNAESFGDLQLNEYVVVEGAHGLAVGRVVIAPNQLIHAELAPPLKLVLRRATMEDWQQKEAVQIKEEAALVKGREVAKKLSLPMKILDAQSNLEGNYLTIFFSAEGRVDFRQMVHELAEALKARIELRQVGPKDETKLLGGLGRCGQPLCCATFLTDFNRLSVRLAKEQNLSPDPTKITGVCGRLLCCLEYEVDFYRTMREKLPPVGQAVITPLGEATVFEANILKGTLKVQLENQATLELPLSEVKIKENPADRKRKKS